MKTLLDSVTVTVEEIDGEYMAKASSCGKNISAYSTRDYAAVAALFDDLKKLAIQNMKDPGYGEFITPAHLENEKAEN